MELTIEYLIKKFHVYNEMFFNNNLVLPDFYITKTKRTLGQCSRRGNFLFYKYHINISDYYNRDENGIDNTLIHEMIHLLIMQKGMNDTSSHGRIFKHNAMRINIESKGEFNIATRTVLPHGTTPKDKYSIKTTNQGKTIKKDYNIGLLTFSDNRKFIFVVSEKSIANLEWAFKYNKCIVSWQWFKSTNEMFAHYKVCRTRVSGKYVTENELNTVYYPILEGTKVTV